MNKTTGFWYTLFDMPAVYNSVRAVLLFGKGKMFSRIKDAVALQNGENVLDVGSGPGELSKFFQGNVLQLSIPEKSYDVVLLASFIHHFSDAEVDQILQNLSTVARKRIILLEPCHWKGNPLAWLLLKMDRGAHIRSFEEQKTCVEKYFTLENANTFYSGAYKLSIIVAKQKMN